MSTANFTVTQHTSPCSYIRQFHHGAKHDDAVLHLALKEYRPRKAVNTTTESVTLILAHANGFPTECYEPLFDDLLTSTSLNIHSIWSADQAHQGNSYALNASELGDDPNWTDHSLDLLLMINKFRSRMKPPFIGIAHSMGSAQLVYLAHIHTRLFHSLILIDPILQKWHPPGPNAAMFSSMRRETWESRGKAEASIRRNGFFASMDPRCLDLYATHALRDVPDGKGVTLATPRAQEAWSYVRSNLHDLSPDTLEGRRRERMLNPYATPFEEAGRLVTMRPEMLPIWEAMAHLRPRALYLYGEFSHVNFEETREAHLKQTGTGRGGNGGVEEGGVESQEVADCGHLCAFEKPVDVAKSVAGWVEKEMDRWKEEKEFWATVDTGKSKNGMKDVSDKWIEAVKADTKTERPQGNNKAKL